MDTIQDASQTYGFAFEFHSSGVSPQSWILFEVGSSVISLPPELLAVYRTCISIAPAPLEAENTRNGYAAVTLCFHNVFMRYRALAQVQPIKTEIKKDCHTQARARLTASCLSSTATRCFPNLGYYSRSEVMSLHFHRNF